MKKYFSHPSFMLANVACELAFKRNHFDSHITKKKKMGFALVWAKLVLHTVTMTFFQSTSQLRK